MEKCFIGLHKYEVIKEVEVKDVDTDTVVGINIVSRCKECGKINSTFVSSDSRFLDREYVYVNGVLHRNKIVVFDKNNHVEQFQEAYDRLFGKQDNISKDSSNKTNNKVKLWQKVFLKLIENCMLFMMKLKKQVEK